jgi:hypothetical protein
MFDVDGIQCSFSIGVPSLATKFKELLVVVQATYEAVEILLVVNLISVVKW